MTYHAPQPRAVIEVVEFDDASKLVKYGQTGRVKLTTLTKEFFVPGFLERDEGRARATARKISLGRCEWRPSISRLRRNDDGGRVLMGWSAATGLRPESDNARSLKPEPRSSDSPLGPALLEHGRRRGDAFPHRRADCESRAGQCRPDSARHAQGAGRARRAAQNPGRRTDCAHEGGRRSLHERRAAAGRRLSDARGFCRSSSRRARACPLRCAART